MYHAYRSPRSASAAPLSDLIAACSRRADEASHSQFIEAFRQSRVGVIAVGVPEGTTGDVTSTPDNALALGVTRHAGGRPMVLAFADPAAFRLRFGARFNAEMPGEAVLQTAMMNPECQGVLVNSAIAETSIFIDRETIASLLGERRPPGPRPRRRWRNRH